jgi:hypothetical protein
MTVKSKQQSTKWDKEPAQIHQMAVDVGARPKWPKWKHFSDFHRRSNHATTAHPTPPLGHSSNT